MSQHIFKTTDPKGAAVEVLMGYDRPLQYVFCTVFDADGETLYSNLDDEKAGCTQQDIEYYRPILTRLGLTIPESMFDETKRDQAGDVGNRVMRHEKL